LPTCSISCISQVRSQHFSYTCVLHRHAVQVHSFHHVVVLADGYLAPMSLMFAGQSFVSIPAHGFQVVNSDIDSAQVFASAGTGQSLCSNRIAHVVAGSVQSASTTANTHQTAALRVKHWLARPQPPAPMPSAATSQPTTECIPVRDRDNQESYKVGPWQSALAGKAERTRKTTTMLRLQSIRRPCTKIPVVEGAARGAATAA
jgi:hypothetical protein